MKWYYWLFIAIAAIIVLAIILHLINRHYKRNYGMSLYGGGFFLLIAVGLAVLGGVLISKGKIFGAAFFVLTLVIFIWVYVYDAKRIGAGKAVGAWICQLLFCAPTLILIFDLLFNHGRSTASTYRYGDKDMRYYRQQQRKKRQDDYDNYDKYDKY